MIKTNTKVCSICGKEKSISEFYSQNKYSKKKGSYIYYQPYCKDCASKKAAQSYESNREDGLIYRKLHYHTNKEHYRVKQREADQRNRENRRKSRGKWQRNHPEKLKEYNSMHRNHKISNEEWENCKNYFNYRCAYCGLPIEEHYILYSGKVILGDFHKEHVDDCGANDLSNCIPSCKTCNVKKKNILFLDWYSSTNENFEQLRFDKILKWITEDYKIYIEKH